MILVSLGIAFVVLLQRRALVPIVDTQTEIDEQFAKLNEIDEVSTDYDEASAEEARVEIQKSIAGLSQHRAPAPQEALGSQLTATAITVLLLPLIAIGVYALTGAPRLAQFSLENPHANLSTPEGSVDLLLVEAEKKLIAEPQHLPTLAVLARTYLAMEKFDKAKEYAARRYELANDDPEAILQYADALAMSNGGALTPEVLKLVDEVLNIDPTNVNALTMAGMAAAQTGRSAIAVRLWRRALAHASDPGFKRNLVSLIEQFGGESQTHPTQHRLKLRIVLADTIADVAGDDIVFVTAHDIETQGPPLAVRKIRVADLPFELSLSEKDAMAPSFSLKGKQRVRVRARVARSGAAKVSPDDWIGEIGDAAVGISETQEILIATRPNSS